MSLDWIPRAPKDEKKHFHFGDEKYLGTEAPCTMYEKKPLLDPNGNEVEGLYVAWITLNNPAQYNSYTSSKERRWALIRLPMMTV